MSAYVSVKLPRSPEAPARARRAVQDIAHAIHSTRLPDVHLLVSELVTNSVKYGGDGPIRLEVAASPERIRAEIIDQGAGFVPEPRDDDLERVGGWGLRLVDALSESRGTYAGSTHVWFEMRNQART